MHTQAVLYLKKCPVIRALDVVAIQIHEYIRLKVQVYAQMRTLVAVGTDCAIPRQHNNLAMFGIDADGVIVGNVTQLTEANHRMNPAKGDAL
ncbi:MAG: hypothetical protein WBJ03_11715 [Moraxellaceae bacterium]